MVSIGAFGPGDPGSNPGWFNVLNLNQKLSFNTRIIQAYDRAMPVVISLVGVDK